MGKRASEELAVLNRKAAVLHDISDVVRLRVEDDGVGKLAGSQASDRAVRPDLAGGVDRHGADRLPDGDAVGDEVFQLLMEVRRRAGDGAVREQRVPAAHGDGLAAEIVLAVRETGGAHRVAEVIRRTAGSM